MVKSRVLEERLIQIYRQGQGYFWIGGPGEESFGVPLGLLVKKGQGLQYDFLHLHYRAQPTLTAMGMSMKEAQRLMMNRASDEQTGGRNFTAHFCKTEWNVAPVSSVVGSQYSTALGTAHVQSRSKTSALTIVTGGDAGTAEPDFASCLIWASRPANPLPLLMTVQNNGRGISTPYKGQHGESCIADRARAFNINSAVIENQDPVETYLVLKEKMDFIRKSRKPAFVEVKVSRLYGHSSADGALRDKNALCSIRLYEEKLKKAGLLTEKKIKNIWKDLEEEAGQVQQEVRKEPAPQSQDIWKNIYAKGESADWRKF